MINLILKIKELENTKGQPYNSVKLKKARRELTNKLLESGKDILEVEDFVLRIGYTNKNKKQPYTQIFTKESFENYKSYKRL